MVIRYVVMFYHGTEDISNVLNVVKRYKDRNYVMMSTANANDVTVLDRYMADYCRDNADAEISCYDRGFIKIVPINGRSKEDIYTAFMDGISSLVLKDPNKKAEVVVHIGNANPFEAYMASYFQPAFNYRVFTDVPRDLYMPEHPKAVDLNESDIEVMGFIYRRMTPVCGADLAVLDRFSIGKKQYKVLNKLLRLGLVETVEWDHGTRMGMKTYFQLTFEGRYWSNRYNAGRKAER